MQLHQALSRLHTHTHTHRRECHLCRVAGNTVRHLSSRSGVAVWQVRLRTDISVYTHPFNGPFSGTTRVRRYQKSKTNVDFTEARDSEWQWHQLGHMQVCTSLQTDNHASTPPLSFYRPDTLPVAQLTTSKH